MELWSEEELDIFRQFRFICINCSRKAVVLHELIPRSRLKDWKCEGNRVPLCLHCHEDAHRSGTRNSRKRLSEQRDLRLKLYAST